MTAVVGNDHQFGTENKDKTKQKAAYAGFL